MRFGAPLKAGRWYSFVIRCEQERVKVFTVEDGKRRELLSQEVFTGGGMVSLTASSGGGIDLRDIRILELTPSPKSYLNKKE